MCFLSVNILYVMKREIQEKENGEKYVLMVVFSSDSDEAANTSVSKTTKVLLMLCIRGNVEMPSIYMVRCSEQNVDNITVMCV